MASKRKKKLSKPESHNDKQVIAAETAGAVFREVFRAIEEATRQDEHTGHLPFYPDGAPAVEVEVAVDGVQTIIRIGAGSRLAVQPMRELEAVRPESFREARRFNANDDFNVGDHEPQASEVAICGAIQKKIRRTDPEFAELVSNTNINIVFKDEENTGADKMMSMRLNEKLNALSSAVAAEWPGVKLRVTEAWDEDDEHAGTSLHYEGRAADLTTQPIDGAKLGRLARLAVNAGLDWTLYEDQSHIHVSVKRA